MSGIGPALAVIGCAAAGLAGFSVARAGTERSHALQMRAAASRRAVGGEREVRRGDAVRRYLERLSSRLASGATDALSREARRRSVAPKSRGGAFFSAHARRAGLDEAVTMAAFCEGRLRLALAFGLGGALCGAALSPMCAGAFALMCGAGGWTAPRRLVKREEERRAREAERCLSEMLETIALGLRSGLSFDRSFALYGAHFDSPFACACASAYRTWALGLATREDALRALADSYSCDRLARTVTGIIRSLRFGTALAAQLESEAADARAAYRADLQERVARAPVKMMLPTGTLILPAMLLLVLGPILLELGSGW